MSSPGCLRVCAAVVLTLGLVAEAAHGFEFLDGNLRVHGFVEEQIRGLAEDLDASDDFDLAQWYSILGLELEWQIAPQGWGPFSLLDLVGRLDVRYDCMWSRCGLFRSVNTYGDRASHLPGRVIDAHRAGFTGTVPTGDTRRYAGIPADRLGFAFRDEHFGDRRRPLELFQVPGFSAFFGFGGPDGQVDEPGTPGSDDPANTLFADIFDRCIFAGRRVKGVENGVGAESLGPWNQKCPIRPIGALRDEPNPFRGPVDVFGAPRPDGGDVNPILVKLVPDPVGSAELPYRRAPDVSILARAPTSVAQGIYYPAPDLARSLREGGFDDFDQNFREAELEWNRGASQQDEKELKELYLDLELFQGFLWLRLGKQNIVWGKTELFRTTDQFNPQDLAISTLPSLEESRIALWALRGSWSFYDVGSFEDVKLEAAINYDQFEPSDVGRCGEPFATNPVCAQKAFGLFAHGLTGVGAAGEIRPPDPWNSSQGIEAGVRFEFRWDRFGFALSDFYGYSDAAYADLLVQYERNVDPSTGRPRIAGARGVCADPAVDPDCLQPENSLELHHANQTLFALLCANSIGFLDLDPTSCAQSVFNSVAETSPGVRLSNTRVVVALSNLLAGDQTRLVLPGLVPGLALPPGLDLLVDLSRDPNDGPFLPIGATPFPPAIFEPVTRDLLRTGLQGYLTDEQEALLGCGPFFGTSCDAPTIDAMGVVTNGGIDLLNAEASALVQSFVGFEGTFGDWSTFDATRFQPGTLGFAGGPVCSRADGGGLSLPGCRGPGDPGYTIGIDGDPSGLLHPFTRQPFRTEMAVVSFNLMVSLVASSAPPDRNGDGMPDRSPRIDDLDPANPFRLDGCSFAKPQFCSSYQGFFAATGVTRATLRAGGNGRFGRRDFLWHDGGAAVLRYEKRNVLGFAMDFTEEVTRTNWAMESTWIEGLPLTDNDARNGLTTVDQYNLTISVDRPTFVNLINPNRSLFLNSQWFLQYVDGYRQGFPSNGPFNVLATLTVSTGYLQDRLLPSLTGVYDFRSNSGAMLFEIALRPSQALTVAVGMNLFAGHFQPKDAPIAAVGLQPNRVGPGRDRQYAENGLSVVRDLDQIFLRIRYSF